MLFLKRKCIYNHDIKWFLYLGSLRNKSLSFNGYDLRVKEWNTNHHTTLTIVYKNSAVQSYLQKILHYEKKFVEFNDVIYVQLYDNGLAHRSYGPAFTIYGKNQIIKTWYTYGQFKGTRFIDVY